MTAERGEIFPNIIDFIEPTETDVWTLPGENLSRSYHWKIDDKNIFLYLNISKGKDFLKVKANLDSEEVKGQGQYLWVFLKKKLKEISNGSVGSFGPMAVAHLSTPNQYAKHLLDSDIDYKKMPNGEYVGFFTHDQVLE